MRVTGGPRVAESPKGAFLPLRTPQKLGQRRAHPGPPSVSFLVAPDGERPKGADRGVHTHKSLCVAECDRGVNKVSTRDEQNQRIFFRDRKRQEVGDVA